MGMALDIRERIELQQLLRVVQAHYGLPASANLAQDAVEARRHIESLGPPAPAIAAPPSAQD